MRPASPSIILIRHCQVGEFNKRTSRVIVDVLKRIRHCECIVIQIFYGREYLSRLELLISQTVFTIKRLTIFGLGLLEPVDVPSYVTDLESTKAGEWDRSIQ